VTEIVEFDGPHLLPAIDGWEEVADFALDWALKHAGMTVADHAGADDPDSAITKPQAQHEGGIPDKQHHDSGQAHTIDSGCREVAETSLAFVERFRRFLQRTASNRLQRTPDCVKAAHDALVGRPG
jgi:hypothetical protein